MLYPFTFNPIFHERVWGGRRIKELYGKDLPLDVPIGESWEISDRPDNVSVINNGPLAGKDLRWLVKNHPEDLFGPDQPHPKVFPWLIKILDAQDKLSLQVHPPADIAKKLEGEPKTEMWYVASAEPDADIFVGLKKGVTRDEFRAKITDGTVADCFHRIEVKTGDAMMLESGRVHALGAGSVIFEIQQNSDTTYRVFDWNRVGLDGKPRELHIENSMKSIDFDDFEPELIDPENASISGGTVRKLVNDTLFKVDKIQVSKGRSVLFSAKFMRVVAVLSGGIRIIAQDTNIALPAGGFSLIPACVDRFELIAESDTELLFVQPGALQS